MFQDLKVVELAGILAGPAVGMFFAELGASVIKVENKRSGGDLTRSWRTSSETENSVSAYYSSVNFAKTVLFADLGNPEDHLRVSELLKDADIVIANFKKGDEKRFGLSYEELKKQNPKLIYASITGFPDSSRPAFDVVLQAETGFMSINGQAGSGPVKMPVALIDIIAAHQLKEAILIALLQREKTGAGAFVEVSLYESAIASLANQAANYLMTGKVPVPMGSLHPNIAPYGETFLCADGKHVVLAVGSDEHFRRLCAVINFPSLAEGGDFNTNALRVKNRDDLYNMLQSYFVNLESHQMISELTKAGVPAGVVKDLQDVFRDPVASEMVLQQKEADGSVSKRVRTAAFRIRR